MNISVKMSQPKRSKLSLTSNLEKSHVDEVYSQAKKVEFPWLEAAPVTFVDWLEKFSRARNVVKEFVLWPLLTAISALVSPKTKVRASSLYPEPVNIYTLFLAESGSNKSTAFSLSIDPIVQYVEEKQNTVIVVEDSSRSGIYEHLKTNNGQGLIAKDEAHAFFQKILCCTGRNNGKELNSELLCKFHDGKPWLITKGRKGKRDGPKETGVAFCGASQPRSFLSRGVFVKMANAGDGLLERIMIAAPKPNLLPPREVQTFIEELRATQLTELSRVFDGIYHQHQTGEARIYELSAGAKIVYNDYCTRVIEEQNAKFNDVRGAHDGSSSSKDTKHVIRLAVILQILFHAIDKALGLILPTTPLSLEITKENMHAKICKVNAKYYQKFMKARKKNEKTEHQEENITDKKIEVKAKAEARKKSKA